jgi:hypothetical protein
MSWGFGRRKVRAREVASLQNQAKEGQELGRQVAAEFASAMRLSGLRRVDVAPNRAWKIIRYEMANVEYTGAEGNFLKPALVGFDGQTPVVFELPHKNTSLVEVSAGFLKPSQAAMARPTLETVNRMKVAQERYTRRQASAADYAELAAQLVSGELRKGFVAAGLPFSGTEMEKWEQMAVAIAKTNSLFSAPNREIA